MKSIAIKGGNNMRIFHKKSKDQERKEALKRFEKASNELEDLTVKMMKINIDLQKELAALQRNNGSF